MPDYMGLVEQTIRATKIHSLASFSWFDEPALSLPARTRKTLPESVQRSYLVYQLQMRLYRDLYGKGYPAPGHRGETVHRSRRLGRLVRDLQEANRGRGYWEGGWRAGAVQDGRVVATRGDLELWVPPEDAVPEWQDAVQPGSAVRLRFEKDSIAVSPGFYMAASDACWTEDADENEQIVRLYWHLRPATAITLMHEATTHLNRAHVPFRLKVLNDPSRYTRCDAGVLYVRKRDCQSVLEVLAPVYEEVASGLGELAPAFTKPLAPGLGLAEDPGEGDSFGVHRCGLIAEALVRAHERGKQTVTGRLNEVVARFEESGLNLERPYLQPGSNDTYRFERTSGRGVNLRVDGDTPEAPTSSHLQAATAIGQDLCAAAIWDGDCCNWIASEAGPDGQQGVYRALGPGLRRGTTGIAVFLARLYAECGDHAFRSTALGAMRHALAYRDRLAGSTRLGVEGGDAGIALGAAHVDTPLGDQSLVDAARDLAKGIMGSGDEALGEMARVDPLAIVALLALGKKLASGEVRDFALALGRTLLSHRAPTEQAAYTLLELYGASGEEQYLRAAEAAIKSPEHRGKRNASGGAGNSVWRALSHSRAWELTGDQQNRLRALDALGKLAASLENALARDAVRFPLTENLLGAAQGVVYGASITGLENHASTRLAERIACVLGTEYLRSRPPADSVGHVVDITAGDWATGLFLLRRHNPATPCLDYPWTFG